MEAEFTIIGLFLRADIVVKIVMFVLIVASIWSWGAALQKWLSFRNMARVDAAFEDRFWSGKPLDALYEDVSDHENQGMERVFCAAMAEWQLNFRGDAGFAPGTMARIDRAMDVMINREAERLSSGLTTLATIGSVAPFVGLFGTVWGIMGAFLDIAIEQNTNLAVVAPGIAEALFATGLGLVAAIPAVVFYNKLSVDSQKIGASYEGFADEFSAILGRQMDG